MVAPSDEAPTDAAIGIEEPGIEVDVASRQETNIDADVVGGREHGTIVHDISQWQAMLWTDAFSGEPDRLNEEDEPIGVDEEHYMVLMIPCLLKRHYLCLNMMDH
uniref:Uncharacterized protein n=1 Tax=Oryza punctata TaxID=4537 RepID=A0A0E0KNF9_ORYPU